MYDTVQLKKSETIYMYRTVYIIENNLKNLIVIPISIKCIFFLNSCKNLKTRDNLWDGPRRQRE